MEFVLHGIGVLVNCVDLNQLLSLSSALVVCLKAPTESGAFVRNKDDMLAAIDRIAPSVLERVQVEKDQEEDDTSADIVPQSGKYRDTSPFSIALRRRIAEKLNGAESDTSDSPNLMCYPKVVDYLETYIFPLALLWSGLLLGNRIGNFL